MNVEKVAVTIEYPPADTTHLEASARVKLSRHIANLGPIRLPVRVSYGLGQSRRYWQGKLGPFYADGIGNSRPHSGLRGVNGQKPPKNNWISVEGEPNPAAGTPPALLSISGSLHTNYL